MTSVNRRVSPLVQRAFVGVLFVVTACARPNPVGEMRHPSHDELLREAEHDYTYVDAGEPVAGTPSEIGKYGAVTGVTMRAASATRKSDAQTHSREVVARFTLTGGSYLRLGMHEGENYVFLEHDNEHAPGAIMTRAYYVVPENSDEIRYLIVDKRVNLVHGGRYTRPVVVTADPEQAYVFGGCIEGDFCDLKHCSVTDAGDLY